MFTTIQALEQEIDTFHQNIKESNELIRLLSNVVEATHAQTDSFEARTKVLHEELAALPPELTSLFQEMVKGFTQAVHQEHQTYQSAVTDIMNRYAERIAAAESAVVKVPGVLETQNEASQKRYFETLEKIESNYAQTLTSSMERLANQVSSATDAASKVPDIWETRADAAHKKYLADLGAVEETHAQKIGAIVDTHSIKLSAASEALAKFPAELELQMQKHHSANVATLKQIQEQYATDLAKANEAFSAQLKAMMDAINVLPGQINEGTAKQYNAFLKELERMQDNHLAKLSATEKHIEEMGQQLEAKYNAFVNKLESTNMDQLYKFCQDMNKSINTKLIVALGGVAVAVVVSIVALFI